MNLGWESHWCRWLLQKPEACLFRGAVAFLSIAVDAGGDNVLPILGSPPSDRDHMVVCKSDGVELLATILTTVVVTHKQVMTRKLYFRVLAADLDIVK